VISNLDFKVTIVRTV